MSGEPDPLYVRARTALIDAAEALGAHLNAIVLVGAQAIYLHTGEADIAVAEYTTDADFSIGPAELADAPLIADLMAQGGFTLLAEPGTWRSADGINVDLMVPELLAGEGRRGARLGLHGSRVARRARGLEATLVDYDLRAITSLEAGDGRSVTMKVAGPGALLVAKVHKISERAENQNRIRDKDALDVLRLLQAIETSDFVQRVRQLELDDISSGVTSEAIHQLPRLFGTSESVGTLMAIRSAGPLEDPARIAASLSTLAGDLIDALMNEHR